MEHRKHTTEQLVREQEAQPKRPKQNIEIRPNGYGLHDIYVNGTYLPDVISIKFNLCGGKLPTAKVKTLAFGTATCTNGFYRVKKVVRFRRFQPLSESVKEALRSMKARFRRIAHDPNFKT